MLIITRSLSLKIFPILSFTLWMYQQHLGVWDYHASEIKSLTQHVWLGSCIMMSQKYIDCKGLPYPNQRKKWLSSILHLTCDNSSSSESRWIRACVFLKIFIMSLCCRIFLILEDGVRLLKAGSLKNSYGRNYENSIPIVLAILK